MNGLRKEFGDRIIFTRINIHNPENKELLERFGFTTTPELYLVDTNGKITGAWSEGVTRAELKRAFEGVLHE